MIDQLPPWGDRDRRERLSHVEDAPRGAPAASYSLVLRAGVRNDPGMLGRLTSAIGEAGGDIGAIDLIEMSHDRLIRDFTVNATDERHGAAIVERVRAVEGVEVIGVSDRTFLLHVHGKIEIRNKIPIRNRDDLSMAYAPGAARVCMAIQDDPDKAYQLTIKHNTVAVVSDGSAVLGLGEIAPAAAMPVLEGKAMLFKEFAGIDAFPLSLAAREVDEIVQVVRAISPGFGAIHLEEMAAPRCYEIVDRLRADLEIPVFHDDHHGTAIVVLAALLNALRVVGKPLADARVVVAGAGAAATGAIQLLLQEGARYVVAYDRGGILYRGREERMDPMKRRLAELTNPDGLRGGLDDALAGADVFIGLAGPDLLTVEALRRMASDPIVFALANPRPEIAPAAAAPHARVLCTGRADWPNQISNVLAFPGVLRGALDCRARQINDSMCRAAARAIAGIVSLAELQEDYIIPSVFNRRVVDAVAQEVTRAAYRTGVARRRARG